jgi:hypothetical protein
MSLERRLQRLEDQSIRAAMEPITLEEGIDPDEIMAEGLRFLALTDAEQDAQLADEIARAEAAGDTEHVRILTDGWAAIKSSR